MDKMVSGPRIRFGPIVRADANYADDRGGDGAGEEQSVFRIRRGKADGGGTVARDSSGFGEKFS